MKDIKLTFYNRSNDINNSDIVIFQKNVATGYNELAVAWKVIQYCGQGDRHPFSYPLTMQVGASDSYGNFSPLLDAYPSQMFHVSLTTSGDVLSYLGSANYPEEVQVLNDLPQGSINTGIYKDGRLLATKTSVSPQQMAAFQFNPTIWIGAVSQIEEGEVMDSAIVQAVNTELSLLGVASADIVMTGGGGGPTARPFTFSLQNVVRA